MEWNEEALATAISDLIMDIDYDVWKYIKCDEEDSLDHMPEWVELFKAYYEAAL